MKTKIKRTLSVVMFTAISSATLTAQTTENSNTEEKTFINIKFCNSHEDFDNGNWNEADSIQLITKSRSKQMWWGGGDFSFDSEDKELKKKLKKEVYAVMLDDTLLLNTRPYKDRGAKFPKGYARAYRMNDGRLLMTYTNVKNMNMRAMTGGMFGLVGGLVAGASGEKQAKRDVCYIVSPGNKDAEIIDKDVMTELLKDNPDLLEEYNEMDKKKRLLAENIMPLLRKAKLMKE